MHNSTLCNEHGTANLILEAMRFTTLWLVSAAFFSLDAVAGDIVQEVQRDFRMGLFPRQTTTDLQPFSGALGGAKADPITKSGNSDRPFQVKGDTFTDFATAANRACDNQKNACADLANQSGGSAGFKVGDCDQQSTQCKAAASSATTTSFATLTSQNADFDFFCE